MAVDQIGSEQRCRAVPSGVETVNAAIDRLVDRIDLLRTRLAPVLRPSLPAEAPETSVQSQIELVPLASTLVGQAARIQLQVTTVEDILDRLEL